MNKLIKIALILLAGATVSRMVRRKQLGKTLTSTKNENITVQTDGENVARSIGISY